MTTLSEDDVALLGLSSPSQARHLDTKEPPLRPVEEGKGSPMQGAALAAALVLGAGSRQLVEAPAAAPQSTRMPSLLDAVLREAKLLIELKLDDFLSKEAARVRRWQAEEGVYALSTLRAAIQIHGSNELFPGDLGGGASWVIDARTSPARAHIASDEGEFWLRFQGKRFDLWKIERASDPAMDGLQAFRPSPAILASNSFRLAPPEPGELLGESAETWLLERCLRLRGSTSWIDQSASVGLALRMRVPPTRSLQEEIRQRLAGLLPAHQQRAVDWATHLPPRVLEELEQGALSELDRLNDLLDEVSEGDLWDDLARLESLLLLRDTLESVAHVLHLAGKGGTLKQGLADLDRQAELQLSALQGVSLQDRQLAAVAWQDPLAWWGIPSQATTARC